MLDDIRRTAQDLDRAHLPLDRPWPLSGATPGEHTIELATLTAYGPLNTLEN